MKSYSLQIEGQVQGVGFRPFVFRLARDLGISGWVIYKGGGVHIQISPDDSLFSKFKALLLANSPLRAKIQNIFVEEIPYEPFQGFHILSSQSDDQSFPIITPDFATCPNCLSEMNQIGNRRMAYPFIACSDCGPRYSILRRLPYDRENTTMGDFTKCEACAEEYLNPTKRRFHAQNNACPHCPIELSLYDDSQTLITQRPLEVIQEAVQALFLGDIIAVKGIGGYMLLADARNPSGIARLRNRKNRPDKPFALMFPSEKSLKRSVFCSEEAWELVSGPIAPICLLSTRPEAEDELALNKIAPGLLQLGVMLPYDPLLHLIARGFGHPMVATSGNIGGAPIMFQDREALRELNRFADYIVCHNREILTPQDDSVIRFSPFHHHKILIRRSRGLAPSVDIPPPPSQAKPRLALGAQLKSTLALNQRGTWMVSQYLGNHTSLASQGYFKQALDHILNLVPQAPKEILVDSHPDYFSHKFGKKLAVEKHIKLKTVPHHLAHFAAILGERQLISHPEPVLGVIWDSTGLGDDGAIWGGEFFLYEQGVFTRIAHIAYFDYLGGERMARFPRLSALSLGHKIPELSPLIQARFESREWDYYQKLLRRPDNIHTSSMGRVFDAMACLLLGIDEVTFEGQAALLLEALATRFYNKAGMYAMDKGFTLSLEPDGSIDLQGMLRELLLEKQEGANPDYLAARFLVSLVKLVHMIADEYQIKHIACSGGVFQNALLADLLTEHLGNHYQLYFHEKLSPNDENIAFGQLHYTMIQEG